MGYFKGKQFKKDIILVAVGYYCRFSLSYRDVSEILFRIYGIICTKRIFSMIHNYTSNVSREQFELIREDLENARKRTRPRTVDLYEVFCGVLYVLTTGCQWRNQ